MKYFIIFSFIAFTIACNEQTKSTESTTTNNDAARESPKPVSIIPETRDMVSKKTVASFSKKIPDELNDWKFAVNVYETKQTFNFLMKMQYMELTAEDTLKIPNFGIEPKVEIREGKDQYSCIIGFLDKNNKFKEYKLISAKDDKLSVKILHRYASVTYRVD